MSDPARAYAGSRALSVSATDGAESNDHDAVTGITKAGPCGCYRGSPSCGRHGCSTPTVVESRGKGLAMDRKTDRRAALKMLTAAPLGIAAGVAMAENALAQQRVAIPRAQAVAGPVEPTAGSWHTWLLSSGSELRLAPAARRGGNQGRDRRAPGPGVPARRRHARPRQLLGRWRSLLPLDHARGEVHPE